MLARRYKKFLNGANKNIKKKLKKHILSDILTDSKNRYISIYLERNCHCYLKENTIFFERNYQKLYRNFYLFDLLCSA